ncbi:ligand-binding sensor domain-containing diguanylate cyclase [Ameyamaea chiangmaiensis]|uniref:diguanylate cyclase n=1 Tax=Ameyamaea chiangmaiensis TaxID=442969 RepID=A0A850P694_9PROT|nr:ligand-binding sensor domain-containing diguanylate cyclase [Ameyamaea chiangmaiensis]NVN40165.1 diguanylate cyclase [Ameyamaea chiangmaiensis]
MRSQGGTFLYDGKAFLPLGEAQGITGDTVFKDLVTVADEKLIMGVQGDRVLVARQPAPFSLQKLHFEAMPDDQLRHPNFRMIRSYAHGAIILAGDRIRYIDASQAGGPRFAPLPPALSGMEHFSGEPVVVGSVGDTAMLSLADGRVCAFASGRTRCWSTTDGLPPEEWGGFISGGASKVMCRSGKTFATIDIASGHVVVESLPDASTALGDHPEVLTLQRLPDGDLITQSQHGVVIRHGGRWTPLYLYDGNSMLWAMLVDRAGSLWLGIAGHGLKQYFGFGETVSWTRETGLSEGTVWSTSRDREGNLWIGTDGGLGRLTRQGTLETVFTDQSAEVVVPDPSRKRVWLQANRERLENIDLVSGQRSRVPVTGINTFRIDRSGDIWIATQHGLFRLAHDAPIGSRPVVCSATDIAFTDIAFDTVGTVWLTGSGILWHFVPRTGLQAVVALWPRAHVELETLAIRDSNDVWVGSDDGLFRVSLIGGKPSVSLISTSKLPSQSINALAVDHEHRLWVGTSNGVGVYDGVQWHGLDITNGLIGNDVAQDAIYVDGDDSVWIGTSRGLSHVQDTASVLRVRPIVPVVLSVSANKMPYEGEVLRNGSAALTIQLGVNAYPSSTRIVYRYRLDHADAPFTETMQDTIVFPSLPPGVHNLRIEAIDPLSPHPPVEMSVPVFVAYPWWQRRWFLALAVCLMVLTVWLLVRLRTAYLLRQQRQLNNAINDRTRELEAANQALESAHAVLTEQSRQLTLQATHDELTGLLNRSAVQAALMKMLTVTPETGLTIALIDIDHFKRLNDTHGHLVGDAVLAALGKRLRSAVRSTEIIGRYGGEEYVLAIPIDDSLGVQRVRSIITSVTADPVTYRKSVFWITVSTGVTTAWTNDTWESAIERADRSLYAAKQQGRNRLVTFDELAPTHP